METKNEKTKIFMIEYIGEDGHQSQFNDYNFDSLEEAKKFVEEYCNPRTKVTGQSHISIHTMDEDGNCTWDSVVNYYPVEENNEE